MELLIPGLIIVAIMVYASTRIKRSAARAFDRDEIAAADFSITKPEGFIHVLNGDPKLVFEAHTKDFGRDGAEDVRQATVSLQVSENAGADEISERAKRDLAEIQKEENNGAVWISGYKEEKGIALEVIHKIVGKGGRVYDLEVTALRDFSDELSERVNEMLESFGVK